MAHPMKPIRSGLLLFALLAGCGREGSAASPATLPAPNPLPAHVTTLLEARQAFATTLKQKETTGFPADPPPPNLFREVKYDSAVGKLDAYVSPNPGDGKKHPAIIWIIGGFSNSISDIAWTPAPPENDQSASAFRQAGIIMMYPSLRGGNVNPGYKEAFYGEVDDVLAAANYLSKLDYVDQNRIYLGGHSTGGTLVLLAAECSNRFRAVFSFGPVNNVANYGADVLPFDVANATEVALRSPGGWLPFIQNPVYVFEGAAQPSNAASLQIMKQQNHNPLIQFHLIAGANHRSILAPVTPLIAAKIVHDDSPKSAITFTDAELNALFDK